MIQLKKYFAQGFLGVLLMVCLQCSEKKSPTQFITAAEILGNEAYPAVSYGGYRHNTRAIAPSIEEIIEDMHLLHAMGIKLIRTYNIQLFGETSRLLEAISLLKKEDPTFEMHVMLGAWIECKGAWTTDVNHREGNNIQNTQEIETAVEWIQKYPDIIKMVAVGNESMVHWASQYYVRPSVVLEWVNYLQNLKQTGQLPEHLWITSSDNFESWGGGNESYHTADLEKLIRAVDFISLHTYPFHDTHYNPNFWVVPEDEQTLSPQEQIDAAMLRAKNYAQAQYEQTRSYIERLAPKKSIHIGETGWATTASINYGSNGSKAADEYKQKKYFELVNEWTQKSGITCFFFEAFDEVWKDQGNPTGSENHFGLFTLDGQAKYALWEAIDSGNYAGLTRNGNPIKKSHQGNVKAMMHEVLQPPAEEDLGLYEITKINTTRKLGEQVTEQVYIISHDSLSQEVSYPSAPLKLNVWEGTCQLKMLENGVVALQSGTGAWWGAGIEIQGNGKGENLSLFEEGRLHFDIKGNTKSSFHLGFQTGYYAQETLINNFASFGPNRAYPIDEHWQHMILNIEDLNLKGNLENVTAPIYIMGADQFDGGFIYLKNIFFTKN
jgi:exo-beta-1,3-glucanase (GH17 family)